MAPARETMPPRRADARRNVERILTAALEAFGEDPDASMGAIAGRAGVARATLYAHFATREALVAELTSRAMAQARAAIAAVDAGHDDAAAALEAVVGSTWRVIAGHHALIAVNTRMGRTGDPELHEPVTTLLRPVVERGLADGTFSPAPVEWAVNVIVELVHVTSREVMGGRLSDGEAAALLPGAVLGALRAARR